MLSHLNGRVIGADWIIALLKNLVILELNVCMATLCAPADSPAIHRYFVDNYFYYLNPH